MTNKSSHAGGTKEENLEEIIDFSVKFLFMQLNSENYVPKHQVNALTLKDPSSVASLHILCQQTEGQILPVGKGLSYITEVLVYLVVLLYNGNQQLMARLLLLLHCFSGRSAAPGPDAAGCPQQAHASSFLPQRQAPQTWCAKRNHRKVQHCSGDYRDNRKTKQKTHMVWRIAGWQWVKLREESGPACTLGKTCVPASQGGE